MSETVTGALFAAAIAALGYVSQLLLQEWRETGRRRADRLARLLELNALLRATGSTFRIQSFLVAELARKLRTNHPQQAGNADGYEVLFASLFDTFTPDEAAEHRIIRGYTEHALRPMNEAVSAWLRQDKDLRIYVGPRRRRRRPADLVDPHAELARSLADLEVHLHLWHAKYAAWFVDQSDHALVYFADGPLDGSTYPRNVERDVVAVVNAELRLRIDAPQATPTP